MTFRIGVAQFILTKDHSIKKPVVLKFVPPYLSEIQQPVAFLDSTNTRRKTIVEIPCPRNLNRARCANDSAADSEAIWKNLVQ